MAPSGIFNSHLIMAACVERNGTPEEQKRTTCRRMASGELRGSIGLTEPNAGTDLQAIRTTARRDGDHYVVNGTKTWITNSLHGTVFAAAGEDRPRGPAAPQGHEPADRREGPGLQRGGQDQEDGLPRHRHLRAAVRGLPRARPTACSAASKAKGFKQTAGGLELGRINVAARGAGIAEGALKMALRYAQEREAFGKPIWQHQAVQLKLADMVTQVEGAKRLIEQAARKYDAGERCDLEAGDGQAGRVRGRGGELPQRRCASSAATAMRTEYDDRALLPRRHADVHRRGHERDPAQVIAKQLIDRHRI
jgi:alkylation response protein AidB-like acyl-CoA dehydrogenase